MKKKAYAALIIILLLSACAPVKSPPVRLPALPPALMPPPPLTAEAEKVPAIPHTLPVNWHGSIAPLLKKILTDPETVPGALLFPADVSNRTNGSLQTNRATTTLREILGCVPQ